MPSIPSRFKQALARLAQAVGIRTVAFEVTQDCNQDCAFCYNVWKCGPYPTGQLDTARTIDLIDRIVRGYRPQVITFTGGEPLLRGDIVDLIRHASRRANCNLITNGTLMTDELARELVDAGVRTFEFTLLSADREIHNALVRRSSFDQLIEGIASVRAAGGSVTTTFVATKRNIDGWPDALELNAALGVSGILFNRFNVGGAGIDSAAGLMPSTEQIRSALAIADKGAERFGISISCGVPIPPCVVDRSPYTNVHFGECPVGTRRAYPTVDPIGNVRPCNHSATILGNLFDSDFGSILRTDAARAYASSVPDECDGCDDLRTCRGGCRAAAEVCGGCGVDPFVGLCREDRRTQECAGFV